MPLPAVLIPLIKSLAVNGLSTIATAVAAKGKEEVEKVIGVKLPDAPEDFTREKVIELRQAELDNEEKLRQFTLEKIRIENQDAQAEHHETQETIRAGDKADDQFVRRTRPAQSWVSLIAALFYAFYTDIDTDFELYVLGMLMMLPWTYAGLRQIGKGIDAWKSGKPQS